MIIIFKTEAIIMRFLNKTISFAAAAMIAAASLTACSGAGKPKTDKLSIVCVSFPEYDWTRNIIGSTDSAEITYLLGSGMDIHNYQPGAKDMLTISGCDIFIFTGGNSETWTEDVLSNAGNKEMKTIRLFDLLGQDLKEEELKEGMEPEEEDEDHGGTEYDEHIWLSLKNAERLCENICDVICEADPSNSSAYHANLTSYTEKLRELDSEYAEMADKASVKTVIFGDRFPFRYLMDDYGIDYYAAFPGCSAETAASFETVATLADKLDSLQLDTVFIIENSDDSIARSIINNSKSRNASIEKLNSIQSVTRKDIDSGVSYTSIMKNNLETLKKVLN